MNKHDSLVKCDVNGFDLTTKRINLCVWNFIGAHGTILKKQKKEWQ